jgi:hypothetical protein
LEDFAIYKQNLMYYEVIGEYRNMHIFSKYVSALCICLYSFLHFLGTVCFFTKFGMNVMLLEAVLKSSFNLTYIINNVGSLVGWLVIICCR